jgi:hypothetical protein
MLDGDGLGLVAGPGVTLAGARVRAARRPRGGSRPADRRRSRRRGRARRSPTARARSRRGPRGWPDGGRSCRTKASASAACGSRPGPCRHSLRGGSSAGTARRSWRRRRPGLSLSWTAAKATVGAPISARKVFSSTRSWAAARALAPGATTAPRRPVLDRVGRDVLELVGDHVAGLGQALQGPAVVIGGDDLAGGDAAGRAVLLRIEDDDVEAEARGGLGQHPAQLAAAEDADGRAGARGNEGIWTQSSTSRRRCRSGGAEGGQTPARPDPTGPGSGRPAGRRSWRPPRRSPGWRPERRPASGRSTAGYRGRSAPWTAPARPAPAGWSSRRPCPAGGPRRRPRR